MGLMAILLMALLGLMPRLMPDDPQPPPALAHVIHPLSTALPHYPGFPSPATSLIWPEPRRDEPIRRFLRRVGGGAGTAFVTVAIARDAFAAAAARRVAERVLERARDPLGLFSPSAPPEVDREDVERLAAYVRELRRLSREEAAERVGRDLGRLAGDVAADALEGRARRRLARGLGDRLGRERPPPESRRRP